MRMFSHDNKRIILVGHEQLRRYGSVRYDGKYVIQNHKTSQRSWKRWADNVIPPGHLENGGIVIVGMNYPTNIHWVWGGLTGWNPPVLEIRNDSMIQDDTWAIAASTFMANSVLQVHYVMPPFHSSSDIHHTYTDIETPIPRVGSYNRQPQKMCTSSW